MILENLEEFFEFANLLIAFIIFFVGLSILVKLEGKLKKAWMWFFGAIALFGVHEIVGTLAEMGIWEIDGLYVFTEFVYILAFAISIFVFRNLFKELAQKKRK